ncbi:MAG: hypothetical protein COA69_08775 [Robiginitomaculum sp.]|nr:MAG: hypothetical protein COA69_08775 [Robiginitomaculum sp.]
MFIQIFLGSILITATIVIEVIFIQIAIKGLRRWGPHYLNSHRLSHQIILLSASTLWLLTALSLSIWIWAFAFWSMGIFEPLERALYFSMVAFTTLGFGDVTLPQDWRLLSGIIAANGLVLFGLNTAFLIEILHRILSASER